MIDSNLWFSDYNKTYTGCEPIFYDTSKIAIAQELEKNYTRLYNELKVIWEDKEKIQDFGKYDSFDDKQYPPKSWKKMVFKVWGLTNSITQKKYPLTNAIISKYPEVTSCFLTRTSPHSVIKTHCGETNAHIRIHLALNIPTEDSELCGIEVLGEKVGWKNGKTFAFLDAHSHHVWNKTETYRYLLIIDIIRPEFKDKINYVLVRVIVSQLAFYTLSKFRFLDPEKVSSGFLNKLSVILYMPILFAIYCGNHLKLFKL